MLERARVSWLKPFHEIRPAQTLAAFRQEDNRPALRASVRRHIERFVSLNHVDVVRRAAAADDYHFALLGNIHGMPSKVIGASLPVCGPPITGENLFDAALLVHHSVDRKRRANNFCHPFAFFIDRITIKQPGADAFAPAALLEIERQHVGGLDGPRRCEAWTNGFASTSESRKIMKA